MQSSGQRLLMKSMSGPVDTRAGPDIVGQCERGLHGGDVADDLMGVAWCET
jgi:hypothetical protein